MLANDCAAMVDTYLKGEKPEISDYEQYDNGTKIVGTVTSDIQLIDKDNYQMLVDDGYYDEDEIMPEATPTPTPEPTVTEEPSEDEKDITPTPTPTDYGDKDLEATDTPTPTPSEKTEKRFRSISKKLPINLYLYYMSRSSVIGSFSICIY